MALKFCWCLVNVVNGLHLLVNADYSKLQHGKGGRKTIEINEENSSCAFIFIHKPHHIMSQTSIQP